MNADQRDRFDRFFDQYFQGILAEVAVSDPGGALRRTRSGFASAYRFWAKVQADGDPVGWVHRVIADDRRTTRHVVDQHRVDQPGHRSSVHASAELRRVVALARRQRAVSTVVVSAAALVLIGSEVIVAHR